MDRRAFLKTGIAVSGAASLPWRHALAAGEWRTYEVLTKIELSFPKGVSRVWLPLPLTADTEWHRGLGNSWSGNASRAHTVDPSKPRAGAERLPAADREFFTAPTDFIPTDGIVRKTAQGIVKNARGD